jgi:hypothetical protein
MKIIFIMRSLIAVLVLLFGFLFFIQPVFAQNVSVEGTVKDNKGVSMRGVSIQIKNSNRGTSTDNTGFFRLNVSRGQAILVTAVGYADTSITISSQGNLRIILIPKASNLTNVTINAPVKTEGAIAPNQAGQDQIVTDMLTNFARSAEFGSGTQTASGFTPGGAHGGTFQTVISGFGALNTINSGVTLPLITHKEETKGSRYLIDRPAHGIIVDDQDHIMKDSSFLINFDKVDGKLLMTNDGRQFTEVDKEKVKAFAIRTRDTSFVFLNVPLIDKNNYCILIGVGQHFGIYKYLKTKLIRSNYVSNGLTESGNNYDEYVDNILYFIVDYQQNSIYKFELKKKSLREALEAVPSGQKFMADHKHDELDDTFLLGMSDYINAQ